MKQTFEQMFAQRNPNYEFLIQRMREAMGLSEVTFGDISTANLRLFKEYMEQKVTANSLFTYFAVLKATFSEMANDGLIANQKCIAALKVQRTPSQHCCLTEKELVMFDEYEPQSEAERDAKIVFMRGAFSGARSCDCKAMTEQNITDGTLTYVSQKTKTGVTQPLHHRLMKYLTQQPRKAHSRSAMNYTIQAICRKLGFTKPVTLSRNGQMVTKPKWQWITLHASRRSFCTSLAVRGVPVEVIAKLAGHKQSSTTSSYYICTDTSDLGKNALAFFND